MVHHHVAVVVATVKDTTVVGAPVRGSHRSRERTLSGQMVHESSSVVVGKSLKAHCHHSGIRGCGIKLADVVGANSKERSVGVGKRLNGSHATTSASTLKWVG